MAYLDATFGIEIECYLPEGATMAMAAAAVSQRLGRVDGCRQQAYGHSTPRTWKVIIDGSLGGMRGAEFVSPVLHGEEGLAEIETVCRALTDFGCSVNRSCGLHVHVGVDNAPLDFFKSLVKLYAIYEPVIDSLMPPSRRASNNSYCRSMTSTNMTSLDRATTFQQTLDIARNGNGRYAKLNLEAYHRHHTVEFRQHSGTLDGNKARRWTVTCLRMVEKAKQGFNMPTTPRGNINRARPGSKSHTVGQMMMRPEGVIASEAIAATGWPSISLPQQAKACGITFTTQRTGRVVRYFAATAEAAPSVTINLDGFASMIGANDEDRRYMNQRAADLRGGVQWAA